MKKTLTSKFGFFWTAVIFIWIKSYLVYLFEFNLDIQNNIQQFLLFFNPISSALIFLGIALFAKGKRAGIWIITIELLMGLLLYANVVFYRFNTDFITLPVLTQTSNFSSLGGSIASLVTWTDLLYMIDIVILIGLFIWSKHHWSSKRMSFRKPAFIILIGIISFAVNLGLAEGDRPQLLKRTFDRNYIVKYLGTYNFAIYDAIQSLQTSTQRVLADSNDITEVENYTKYKYAEPDTDLFGVAAEKN